MENSPKLVTIIAGKLAFLFLIFLLAGTSCTQTETVNSEGEITNCFSNKPLENISWAKKQLEYFQQPKSGPLQVAVFNYKDRYVLVFANLTSSSPSSYMFDCAGDLALLKLNVGYNEFYDHAKLVEVLLETTY